MQANRAFSFPFLGGPISAVLLGLSFGPHGSPALPWFALVPFFLSLHRHRASAVKRLLHGLGFGWTLSVGFLPWVFTAVRQGGGDPEAGGVPILVAVMLSAVAWTAIAAHHALFALAAGPILRLPGRLALLVALPVLWTGLEVARGPFFPWEVPFIANWLTLGYSVPAGSPESQVASLLGVHGMSFIVATATTSFLLMFREARFPRQLSFAALGCLLPLACRLHGTIALPGEALEGRICAVVAANEGGRLDDLARACGKLNPLVADLVVWSPVSLSGTPDASGAGVPRSLGDFLGHIRGILVARATGSGAERLPASPFLIIGGEGAAPGTFTPILGFAGRRQEAGILRSSLGSIGLAAGSQLDSPVAARNLARGGAGILAASTSCPRSWGEGAHHHLQAMHAYRALETQRWLVESSSSGGSITDPYGRSVLRLAWGIEGAEAEQVDSSGRVSFYARAGWWIEPFCLLGAAALIIGALPWKLGGKGGQRQ
jgi:apolipoprotein N-acyltransferase